MPTRPFESIIKELCEEVLSEPNPQALPDKIIQHVQKVFPVEWSTLWVTEQKETTDAKRLRLAAASPKASRLLTAECGGPAVYDFGEGLTGYIAQQTDAVRIDKWTDFDNYPHAKKYDSTQYLEGSADRDCKCVLGVPLLLKTSGDPAVETGGWRVIGVLKLENIQPTKDPLVAHFTDTDVAFMVAYGAVIAVALEKAQMRADSIRVGGGLLQISKDLLDRLGERPDLKRIVEQTARVISAEACALWLRKGQNLFLEHSFGYPGHEAPISYHLSPPDDLNVNPRVGLTVDVATRLTPLNLTSADQVRRHPAWLGANDQTMWAKTHGQACYSLLAIPLVDQETQDLKGVFKIENKKPTLFQLESHFNADDQELLETLGNSICLALIISERIDRLHRLELLIGRIRVLDGLEEALHFILTGLTHGAGLGYNRALLFRREAPGNRMTCGFAIGHMEAADWDLDMRNVVQPAQSDLDNLLIKDRGQAAYKRTAIWLHWCPEDAEMSFSLDDIDNQVLARHLSREGKRVMKYISGVITPGDILQGFAHGDFVLVPIYLDQVLWGVIYADNRFTGDRINEFEHHVLELFAGMAGAVIQAAQVPAQLMNALKQSAGMVTHKVRDYLSSATSLLKDSLEDESSLRSDLAKAALDQARDAQRVVSHFLSFATSKPFERPDRVRPIELVEALRGVVEKTCRSEVTTQVLVEGPVLRVSLDTLRDDFVGFASDSKRHKQQGLSICISAETPPAAQLAHLNLPATKTYVKLVYSDNGPGVSKAIKDKIFSPFYIGRQGGYGLGLTIAAFDASVHGGCIVETGEEGVGVRFEMFIAAEG